MAILVATSSTSAAVPVAGKTAAVATTANSARRNVSTGTRVRRSSMGAQLQDNVHVAQAPPQPTAARAASRCGADAATTVALCQHRDGTVASAPITHTTTTSRPVCGRADSATTPPAVSMTAAASWVGATARRTCRTGSVACGRVSSHRPKAALATAAHKQSTPAISMRHTIRAAPAVRRMGRPPGARHRPGDDGYPGSPRSWDGAGGWGRPGAVGGGVGVGGPGRLTLKPLTIASVASAVATTWSTLVITDNVTRYLSGPAVAMMWRRDVLSVIEFSR